MRYSIVIAALLGLLTAKDLEQQQMVQEKVQADAMEGQEGPAEEVENSENIEVNLKDDEQTPEEDQLLDSKAKEANELEVANGADNFDDGTLDQLVDDVQTSDDEEEQADEKDESEEGEESDDAMLEESDDSADYDSDSGEDEDKVKDK